MVLTLAPPSRIVCSAAVLLQFFAILSCYLYDCFSLAKWGWLASGVGFSQLSFYFRVQILKLQYVWEVIQNLSFEAPYHCCIEGRNKVYSHYIWNLLILESPTFHFFSTSPFFHNLCRMFLLHGVMVRGCLIVLEEWDFGCFTRGKRKYERVREVKLIVCLAKLFVN